MKHSYNELLHMTIQQLLDAGYAVDLKFTTQSGLGEATLTFGPVVPPGAPESIPAPTSNTEELSPASSAEELGALSNRWLGWK